MSPTQGNAPASQRSSIASASPAITRRLAIGVGFQTT
jgi:hypothetical protein